MADVRALLAAERQSRRITHPHLSYTKSGVLICTICNLNVKSEALWEGHLRSANHRKNVNASQETTSKPLKRKLEHVEETSTDHDEADLDARKKPKSRPESVANHTAEAVVVRTEQESTENIAEQLQQAKDTGLDEQTTTTVSPPPTNNTGATIRPSVDEDEWAAFEREVAPLKVGQADYAAATISAAPVSADQLAAQRAEEGRKTLNTEAEDEQEDEARRLEDEFDVMEEMEERVRKLREKREALRNATRTEDEAGQLQKTKASAPEALSKDQTAAPDEDEEEDEEDDWYR